MQANTRPKTSVTRELDDEASPLRLLLRPHQPLLGRWRTSALAQLSGRPWIRPKRPELAWMAGMAIDYRTRWWLTGIDALPSPVLAGLDMCQSGTATQLLEAFSQLHLTACGLQTQEADRAIASLAVAAASVEPLFRAGPVPCALDELGLSSFLATYGDVVDDVLELSGTLPGTFPDPECAQVETGPVIGTGRLGGDADVMVDGRLIEIKAVVKPKASMTRAVRQLLVYAARLRPPSAALFLPRQHTIIEFDLKNEQDLLADLDAQIQSAYAT